MNVRLTLDICWHFRNIFSFQKYHPAGIFCSNTETTIQIQIHTSPNAASRREPPPWRRGGLRCQMAQCPVLFLDLRHQVASVLLQMTMISSCGGAAAFYGLRSSLSALSAEETTWDRPKPIVTSIWTEAFTKVPVALRSQCLQTSVCSDRRVQTCRLFVTHAAT